ncbi:MAG: MATE family efflux transporter [Myxococcota bacterium]|nr:MATE family efflux transporter [Myxococcota bacterium]
MSLPIIGGMVSQNILNLVDTAMVGQLGHVALAAVGLGGFANFLAIAFIMGLSSGVQAMAARRVGEDRLNETAKPLNGGLLLALCLSIPLTLILYFSAPFLFPYLIDDPDVVSSGVPYLQVRLLGIAAVGMNFSFRGYWNGVNLPRLYLKTLLIMHAINVFLNYVLIFGKWGFPEMGATGAGLGTMLSTYIGTGVYIFLGFQYARENGFLRQLPQRKTILTMLRLSIPAGVQQFFFAAGMTMLFWIIGQIGTAEVAASNVLINLLLVCILPGIGFGLACASLVGQALGRKDPDDAKEWGYDVVKIAALCVAILSSTAFIWPDFYLEWFIQDSKTLALARRPLQLIALAMPIDVAGLVLLNALLGAGASRTVMVVSISLQWLLFMPIAWLVGPVLELGLIAIWAAQCGYRTLQTLVLVVIWQRGRWQKINVD